MIKHSKYFFLFPDWTHSVKKPRTEHSRIVHPEAPLQAPDAHHVLIRQLEFLDGEILFDPRHVLRLWDH